MAAKRTRGPQAPGCDNYWFGLTHWGDTLSQCFILRTDEPDHGSRQAHSALLGVAVHQDFTRPKAQDVNRKPLLPAGATPQKWMEKASDQPLCRGRSREEGSESASEAMSAERASRRVSSRGQAAEAAGLHFLFRARKP